MRTDNRHCLFIGLVVSWYALRANSSDRSEEIILTSEDEGQIGRRRGRGK